MESGGGGRGGRGEEPSRLSSAAAAAAAPAGLTAEEYAQLRVTIKEHHRYAVGPGQCSSLLAQRIRVPAPVVWAVVRRFDWPQIYQNFIRSWTIKGTGEVCVGCLREMNVISGLPASTSIENLDVLDDERRVAGFTIIGGEHRFRNYRSVTTVTKFRGSGSGREIWTIVLESYVVDMPEGNEKN